MPWPKLAQACKLCYCAVLFSLLSFLPAFVPAVCWHAEATGTWESEQAGDEQGETDADVLKEELAQ